jgi:hypothetical protein
MLLTTTGAAVAETDFFPSLTVTFAVNVPADR